MDEVDIRKRCVENKPKRYDFKVHDTEYTMQLHVFVVADNEKEARRLVHAKVNNDKDAKAIFPATNRCLFLFSVRSQDDDAPDCWVVYSSSNGGGFMGPDGKLHDSSKCAHKFQNWEDVRACVAHNAERLELRGVRLGGKMAA